ncbi:hypothetical protein Fmac_031552 [Flemingia macrophylla]|uniref:Uncharacterized protein n=1 Tax=Flemingia macrophylla TaxID=520843 RepID=A0ABD1L2D4_9FABA
MANTIFTQLITSLAVGTFGRYPASNVDHLIHHLRSNSRVKHNRLSVAEKSLSLRFQHSATRKMNMAVYAGITPGGPTDPIPGHWKTWILGTIFTILLSFTRGKWGPLLQLKEKVETTIDEAERVVDIIEDVAEKVDKVAEEAVKHLPEGKLREVAEFVEKVAEDVDKHAEQAEEALEKVENVEKDLDAFIKSTTHLDNAVAKTANPEEQQ